MAASHRRACSYQLSAFSLTISHQPSAISHQPFAIHEPSAMSHIHRVAVIAGDGIGKEVIPAGVAAIEKATSGSGLSMSFTDLPWSCDYYLRHQRMMDEDGFDRLSTYDAIYLGALGAPGVSDVASAGLILAIRQRFDQYVNLRPMRLLPGLSSPLANRSGTDIDMICVRETRGSMPGSAAGFMSARRAGCPAERCVHPAWHRPDSPLRSARGEASALLPRDQVERARIRWRCGTKPRRNGAEGLPVGRIPQTTSTRWPRA
jgi:hypothetical protein